jgi:hypothetical protein
MNFDFDCPKIYIDINNVGSYSGNTMRCSNSNSNSAGAESVSSVDEIDPWFLAYHPEHDLDYSTLTNNNNANANLTNSISTSGAADDSSIVQEHESSIATRSNKRKNRSDSMPCNAVSKRGSVDTANRESNNADSVNSISQEIKKFNEKRSLAPAVKPVYLKRENVYKPAVVHSKEDMTKEIRLFNSKRKDAINIPRTSSKVKSHSDKENIDDIEREILALNEANSEENSVLLIAKTKTFDFQANAAATQSTSSTTASEPTSATAVSMRQKLEEFKMKKREGHAAAPPKKNNKAAIARFPPQLDDDLVLEKLKKHNKQISLKTGASVYEPSRHSVRDVRVWETQSGKTWATLSMDEREVANEEIALIKQHAVAAKE